MSRSAGLTPVLLNQWVLYRSIYIPISDIDHRCDGSTASARFPNLAITRGRPEVRQRRRANRFVGQRMHCLHQSVVMAMPCLSTDYDRKSQDTDAS